MRVLLTLPVLVLLVLFAVSNTGPVRLGIWPTDWSIELPVAVAVLGAAAVSFVIGGILVWLGELGRRRQLRRALQNVRRLESQLRERQPESLALVRPRLGPPE